MLTSDLAQQVFAPWLPGPPAETAAQKFVVLPGNGTPRWLLPARSQNIDPVLAGWSPYRLTSRMKWAAIRAACHAGCVAALPGVTGLNMAGIEDIDWRSVGWNGSVPPVPVVYVGTPGASRKAVIHLVNPVSGTCEVIVKVPLTEAAQAAILREADVLTVLADEGYKCAPRLLHVDPDRGVTTQTAINGKAGGRKFTARYWAPLRSLMLADETTTIVGHAAEWQEQLLWTVDCESDIRIMTAALSELCDAHRLPACWVHGDFAPWNVRHLPDGTTALLDWEDAQRSGLPLQDAFHFLHMQDYLFSLRPTAHSGDVESFARDSGVPPEQCRKLEMAYLAHAYLQRLAVGEAEHSEYLLATLRAAMQERHLLPAPTIDFTAQVRPGSPMAASSRAMRIRADLFAAVTAQLNSAEIPYCVLSGHENHAENGSSDVDFMFHPQDMNRIAPLLAQAAQSAGARLIQAIRYETGACYFVLAKDDGNEIGYFNPDCAGDYRKQGRLWLSAAQILAGRRRYKGYYVPAVADEFTYYLIKKVLKQSATDFQLRRLRHLYQRDAVNCRAAIVKFWSPSAVRAVEKALVANDLSWFQSVLPGLLAELKASDPVERVGRRVVRKLQDAARVLGRVLQPTGMAVLVCGGEREQRSAIAQALARQLSPAFRRTASVQLEPAGAIALTTSFRLTIKILAARPRSTLVVSSVGAGFTRGLCPGPSWFASLFARLLFRPDLIFVLSADDGQTFASAANDVNSISTARKGCVTFLNSGLSEEENSQQARGAILRWLATRQAKLLSLARRYPAESKVGPLPEILPDPAGLHLVVK